MATEPTLTTTTDQTTTSETATTQENEGFCAQETRISNHTCNSLHPAISLDCQGNQNIVWYDNRDGNFEIYYRTLPTKLSTTEIADTYSTGASGYARPSNMNCPVGFSGYRLLSELCKDATDSAEEGGIRRVATSIQINVSSLTVYLTDNAADFLAMGISAGAVITFETGLNMGKGSNVKSVVSAKVLELSYAPFLSNDQNFVYYIDNRLIPKESCETRITCTTTPSMFPDVVADCSCRSHIVWHDNETGRDQIYYSQVGYGSGFQHKCTGTTGGSINLGNGTYLKLTTYSGGAYFFSYKQNTAIQSSYKITGKAGQRVTYGTTGDPPTTGRGLHTIFRDTQSYGSSWVGLSKYYDEQEWATLIDANSFVPPIQITTKSPIADPGDFGSTIPQERIAFMVSTPPDIGVELESVTLPFVPKCAPSVNVAPRSASSIADDIVEAPKKPLPPTYVDPVDITAIMSGPYASIDANSPSRYTIEGDPNGTIYTNSYVSDARGQLSQLVFARQEDGSQYKFILSTRKCGNGPCAVRPSKALDPLSEGNTMYSVVLQVWRGPDYRVDAAFTDADENQAKMVYEKEFYLSPGEDMTTFAFAPSELTLNRGSMYYFVPIPSAGLDMMIRGFGGGNIVWFTDGSATFTQYSSAFVLPPYEGMNAPVSFVGYLADSPREDTEASTRALRNQLPAGAYTGRKNSYLIDYGNSSEMLIPYAQLKNSQGIAYNPERGALVASANYPTGVAYNLESVDQNAMEAPYAEGFSGGMGKTNVCIIQVSAGGFVQGDTFCGNGQAGGISKIAAGGSGVEWTWVTLPDYPPNRPAEWTGSFDICHDETGIFDNKLIVVSVTGNIFVVGSDKSYKLLANIPPPKKGIEGKVFGDDEWLKGVVVLPNNPDLYGPWAGGIVVGGKRTSTVYSVSPSGVVQSYDIGVTIEDIKVIKSDDLYVVSVNNNTLYRVKNTNLENNIGDIIITQQEPINYTTQTNYYRWAGGRSAVQWQPVINRTTSGQLWEMHWSDTYQKFIGTKLAGLTSSGLDQMAFANLGCADPPCNVGGDDTSSPCSGEAKVSNPLRLTASLGDNQYPALAVSATQNVWLVWHSTRSGTEEIYAARYFGRCSIWNSSATGGDDLRVTNYAEDGQQRRARFPRVACDQTGNAHVVFQLTDKNGNSQIYYTKSNAKNEFSIPVRLTDSFGDAMMPDIAIAYDSARRMKISVVWHDSRFGNWEIMSASNVGGNWNSSAFGGSDTRITASKADSMFPRVRSDKDGNLRLVFHSNRSGMYNIYMASYSALAQKWNSSANNGDDLKISTGPANSMFPDVDTDATGGVAITWQDDRHEAENPDMHEEVYATYCAKMGHSGRPHFAPLVTNIEEKMDFKWDYVDCKTGQPIDSTNTENVCLKIKGTNATFWRAVNENGQYSEWSTFKASVDLDTTIVPWTLSCGNGTKEVSIQIQDQDVVAFPISRTIVLAKPPDSYKVDLYSDKELTIPIPKCMDRQAARGGNVYVKITTPKKILALPTFDVIQRGLASAFNQETEPVEVVNGVYTSIDPRVTTSEVKDGNLTVQGYQLFRGMFTVRRQDDLYNIDGLARIIVRSGEPCVSRPGSNASTVATVEKDEIILPTVDVHSPGWSAAGGTATWTSQLSTLPVSCADLGLSITVGVSDVPFNLTLGGLAQPFTGDLFAGGSATFTLRIAKRSLPTWLSSFSSRTLKVSLIKDFLLPGQAVIGSVSLSSLLLPEVDLDVISGALAEPEVAGDMDAMDVTITGIPPIPAGTPLAVEVKDETYASFVNEYGANAKMFVIAVGDATVPPSPYYVEEF